MKLLKSFLVFASADAAKWEKCDAIGEIDGQNSLECKLNNCKRKCEAGFVAVKPLKAVCKKKSGKWAWNQELGGCVTCPEPKLHESIDEVECSFNSKNERTCTLGCSEGTIKGGKRGQSNAPLYCKCHSKGQCKWKVKKRKITIEAIEKFFCEADDGSGTNQNGSNENDSMNEGNKPRPDIDNGSGGEDESGKPPKPDLQEDDLETDSDKPPKQPSPDNDNNIDDGSNKPNPDDNNDGDEENNKGKCFDSTARYGVKEHENGHGGCPPKLINYSIVNAEESPNIPIDAHANYGVHLGERSFINAGMGLESETSRNRDAFVTRFDLCSDLSEYGSEATSNQINSVGDNCKKNMKWSWSSDFKNKDDFFGYVAVSPDSSYLIAAGVKQGATKKIAHRWLVKIDAATGETIWEIIMPTNNSKIGEVAGYESIVFTDDGGFIAGGFAKGEYNSINDIFFKSGGQVDGAFPLAEKFSPQVASAGKSSNLNEITPEWTYICDGVHSTACTEVYSSFNTMRIFVENGVEKIATTFRAPKSAILTLNTFDGSEDRFATTNDKDKNQDIEVDFDKNGNISGFVVAGLTRGQDTTSTVGNCSPSKPCDSWDGYVYKISADLQTEIWRQQFSSFPGGVGKYKNLPTYGGSLVYTECFSIAKISNGYAVACGQGMESEEGGGVKGDPRGDWRGTAVGVDMNGIMMWYRMDNWGVGLKEEGNEIPTASSAFEWIASHPKDPSNVFFTTDEAYGMGFAAFDLTRNQN